MNIRVLIESDAQLYQELRLSALKINPEAFGSTYQREEKFSLETVVERLKLTKHKFVLGAFDSGSLFGIVTFMLELIRKARNFDDLKQINLTVVSENDSAKKLYKSVGFEVYGVERNALKFNGRYFDEDLMVLNI